MYVCGCIDVILCVNFVCGRCVLSNPVWYVHGGCVGCTGYCAVFNACQSESAHVRRGREVKAPGSEIAAVSYSRNRC